MEQSRTQIAKQYSVNIVDPKVFSVLEISKIISRSAHVITIDTALVHICAALGKK